MHIVDAPDIARVVGTTPRWVARWSTTWTAPRRHSEERLLEFKAVVDVLRQVMRDEPARLWLRSQSSQFDPRSGGGARLNGGRFNPVNSLATLYL